MKLIDKLSPKRLFKYNKKDKSHVSKFDSSLHSSGSVTSSSSSSSESISSVHKSNQTAGLATPTTVLPELSANFYLELVEAFKTIGKDNDGFITRSELEDLLSKFASQPPSLAELSEGDGDYDEFLSLETLLGQLVAGTACDEPELREIFDVFDTDHDGKITAEELMAFYKEKIGDERCTLEECRLMIASVDKNGDGFVCFEDFSRMMELQS